MKYLLILIFVLGSGCSKKSSGSKNCNDENNSMMQLTYGYSFVYQQLGALVLSEKIFLVRSESKQIRDYGMEIADFAKKLKKDLEAISEKQKSIKLDNTGQSKAENMMFEAISKDTTVKYLPLVGLELKIFERKFLLSSVGLLTQVHFMFGAIMELETSDERKRILKASL